MGVPEIDPRVYHKWRARIPWTDDEICEALAERRDELMGASIASREAYEKAIESVRAGKVTQWAVDRVACVLVKYCGVCEVNGVERKAIYFRDIKGRCSEHRLVR